MKTNLVGRYVKYLKKITCWVKNEPEINSYVKILKSFETGDNGWFLESAVILKSDFDNGSFELMPEGFFPPSKTEKEVEMFPVY